MQASSILNHLGNTPIVPLSRISAGHPGEICMKLEFLNPGGSHKARIAKGMIEAAEREGRLERGKGSTIVEPTGGNTGMGIAMVAALYGYEVLLVVPDTYSERKRQALESIGAKVELAAGLADNGHGQRAVELCLANPGWEMLNQGFNEANPRTHRETTAQEILRDIDVAGVRYLVAGIGTGGHITGVGEVLREENADLRIVGVQPEGCDLLNEVFVEHPIQGLSVGLLPGVLRTELIDEMQSISVVEAVAGMRELMSSEAIFAGLSSGANLAVAKRLLPHCDENECVLTFAYDSAADYLEHLGGRG